MTSLAPRAAATPTPLDLTAADVRFDWQYHWGDPLPDDASWQATPTAANPPGRDGQRFLWLKTQLVGPQDGPQDAKLASPYLHLMIVDQIFEAYIDGELVYRFGEFSGPRALRFAGYPPHLIPLPTDYQGHVLMLRIYSEHINIGVSGRMRIGSAAGLAIAGSRTDLSRTLVALPMIMLGLSILAFAIYLRGERLYYYYGSFATATGLWMFLQLQIRAMIWPHPLALFYIELCSLYLAVTCLGFYCGEVFDRGPLDLTRRIGPVTGTYCALALGLSAVGVVSPLSTLLPFQVLLVFLAVYTIALAVDRARRGSADAKLFAAGFAAAAAFAIYDVLVAVGVVPRSSMSFSHFGHAAFVIALGIILARRFVRVHVEREFAQRKVTEQELLLQAAARMAGGDLSSPLVALPNSPLAPLARGLESMRRDIQQKVSALQDRNAEIQQLNDELRHQIEQRSQLLVETMMSALPYSSGEIQPLLGAGMLLAKRYRVGAMLGQGAMGVVYEVERVSDRRSFAAKVLGGKPSRQAMARFAREAQLLARLKHPNLIAIVDAGLTEARLAFIVMELVRGKSLDELHERYGEPGLFLPVLRQIADALAATHAGGVVHREQFARRQNAWEFSMAGLPARSSAGKKA